MRCPTSISTGSGLRVAMEVSDYPRSAHRGSRHRIHYQARTDSASRLSVRLGFPVNTRRVGHKVCYYLKGATQVVRLERQSTVGFPCGRDGSRVATEPEKGFQRFPPGLRHPGHRPDDLEQPGLLRPVIELHQPGMIAPGDDLADDFRHPCFTRGSSAHATLDLVTHDSTFPDRRLPHCFHTGSGCDPTERVC